MISPRSIKGTLAKNFEVSFYLSLLAENLSNFKAIIGVLWLNQLILERNPSVPKVNKQMEYPTHQQKNWSQIKISLAPPRTSFSSTKTPVIITALSLEKAIPSTVSFPPFGVSYHHHSYNYPLHSFFLMIVMSPLIMLELE